MSDLIGIAVRGLGLFVSFVLPPHEILNVFRIGNFQFETDSSLQVFVHDLHCRLRKHASRGRNPKAATPGY
jgi:hypothetical protein